MRLWGFGIVPREPMVAVSEQSSPLAATNCGVDPDRFALLSNTEPAQVLPSCEEIFEPPVLQVVGSDLTAFAVEDEAIGPVPVLDDVETFLNFAPQRFGV